MKSKYALLLSIIIFTSLFLLKAQVFNKTIRTFAPTKDTSTFCASDEILKLYPKLQEKQAKIDQKIYDDFAKKGQDQEKFFAPPYILPVVVHIIHQNGTENISDAQVLQGMIDLNEAFANVNYYDQNTGVNTQIQFCLAKQDPDGNATSGIDRIVSPLTNMTMETEDIALKNLSRCEPLHYINIWLVAEICSNSIGCGVAGYAYLPSAHGGSHDGIVQEARWFGTTNANSAVQVHEMGHYLGLYHTFQGGCTNDDCMNNGDRVCDTPPDNSTAAVPCGGSANSCSTDTDSGFATDQDDMFWNYMDYGNWTCYSAFTAGQQDRMHWHIENIRSSLLESEACNEACTVNITALFSPNTDQTVDIGTNINFSNFSTDADTYEWQIDGLTFASTLNASYAFNTLGTYEIMLLATNSDPNCHDEMSITVTVVCPVTSAFSVNNLYPTPGEIVTFTNESTNATDYDWQINGTSEGITQDLIFTFPAQGIYTICLQATNGLCSEEFCQTIFVTTESNTADCSEEPFVKIIGNPNQNEEGYVIIPSGDGNFYLGAADDNSPLLLKMSPGGVIFWERSFISADTIPIKAIDHLLVDSDGMVLIVGYGDDTAQNRRGFIIKYDPITENVLWTQHLSGTTATRATTIIEPPTGVIADHYIVIVASSFNTFPGNQDDAGILKVDKNTGQLTSFSPKNYNLGSSESFFSTLLFNNTLYMGGRYTNLSGVDKMRFSLSEIDLSGNEQWSKLYHVSPNQSARLYGRDILIENQSIFLLGDGDDNGTSTTDVNPFFLKTDMQGNLDWVRKYELFDIGSVNAREVVSVYDGFIILGIDTQGSGKFYLLKVNKDGVAQWAKSYDTGGGELLFYPQSQLIVSDNYLYFTAQTGVPGGNSDILVIKTDLEGNTSSECLEILDLGIEDYYISQPVTTDVNLTIYDSPIDLIENHIFAELTNLETNGCGCIQDTIPCETTFVKTIGTGTGEESGQKVIAEPNGGFLLGASRGDSTLIMLLDENAETLWQRTFKFITFSESIRDMFIDSDGYLVGIGYSPYVNNKQTFVFRYDYINDNMLWARELTSSSLSRLTFYSIVENGTSGNYFISGATWNNTGPGLGCDGLMLEVDRNTGNGLWYNSYDLGSCESFYKLLPVANSLYTIGRNNAAGGGQDRFRGAISQFDLSGNELWSRLYLVSTQQDARLYINDAVSDNGLVTVGYGNLTGTNENNNSFHLFKTDYTGNIQWAKKYEISTTEAEYSRRILNLPDGYLLMGEYKINGEFSIFIMKTDKTGTVQWTKKYGGTERDFGYDIFYQNGLIYLLGESESYGLNGTKDIFLAKLKLDGSIPGDCIVPEDLNVTAVDIANPYDGTHPLTTYASPVSLATKTVSSNDTYLEEQLECYVPCVEIDTCLILPDADLVMVDALCFGDSLHVFLDVCNRGNGILPAGTPISFYEENPTNTTASLIFTDVLPQDLQLDSCIIFEIQIPTPVVPPIFVMINDAGTTTTPFDLEANLSNTGISECNFLNNLDSFELDFTPPILDLGPDTTMCDNATLTFDAGSEFYTYEWFDGSSEQTYTSWEDGTYWVEVTDSCGGTQIDSITITILPETELQIIADTMICAGTITLTATGFENYQWFPPELVDCDTCDIVEITIDSTTRIEVVGERSPGCYSVDTIFIDVFPPILTMDTLLICEGDTATIFNNPVTVAGDYSETYTSFTDCDSIHTSTLVFTNDTITTEEVISICQGDSTEIFGNFEFLANDYITIDSSSSCLKIDIIHLEVRDTFSTFESITICELDTIDIFDIPSFESGFYDKLFQSETGCDSTHLIELIVIDTVLTFEKTTICENEMASIFGTDTNIAGEYFMVFTSINDCDSTHVIELEVLPTADTEEDIILCAGDSTLIFGSFESTSGDYSQSFAAFNTCDSTHTIHLSTLEPLQANFDVEPSCQGNADGNISATVQGGQNPYQFQWSNGGTESSIENLNPGIYFLTVTDNQACELINQVEITTTSMAVIDIQSQDINCYGEENGLINIETEEIGLSYSLDGENYQDSPIFENLLAGIYDLYINDVDGCVSIFEIGVFEPNELILNLPEDRTILLGDSTAILSITNGGDSLLYNWYPNNWLSCNDCAETVASPAVSTLYSLSITDLQGCTTSDAILISIDQAPRVYIPNVFSPNDDGFNDLFFINAGNDVEEIKLFQIYDRWGEHVFEAKNFQANDPTFSWDGRFNNVALNSGVFVYYAEILFVDGRVEVMKGDVMLLK